MKWNYFIYGSFTRVEIDSKKSGKLLTIILKNKDGKVSLNSGVSSRFDIDGNATLVISAVETADSGSYRCGLLRGSTTYFDGDGFVELIVTGKNFTYKK